MINGSKAALVTGNGGLFISPAGKAEGHQWFHSSAGDGNTVAGYFTTAIPGKGRSTLLCCVCTDASPYFVSRYVHEDVRSRRATYRFVGRERNAQH